MSLLMWNCSLICLPKCGCRQSGVAFNASKTVQLLLMSFSASTANGMTCCVRVRVVVQNGVLATTQKECRDVQRRLAASKT